VTDDERTVERTRDVDESEPSTSGESDPSVLNTDDPDAAAAAFHELDAALDLDAEAPAERRRGLVVDAQRTDASAVPSGYPLAGDPDEVVALTVDTGEDERTVYLGWPGADADAPLVWLLEAMDIELRDLYGREVLLDRIDGHDVLVTPSERPRGSPRWRDGVVAGLGVVATTLALLLATGVATPLLALLWALATFLWLPYATFEDAWYLRTHSDWDGGPLFWATLAALPGVNLFTGAAYLVSRSRATFFGDSA
jgi:hypothetical protein